MKKVFLLGTMLGVTTAALAFGGMFKHGSKSTTYKGGVDAIGVHFGGEKKNDSHTPCPDGLEHNTDGSCTVCANGNIYLSYMPDLPEPVGACDTAKTMSGSCVSNKDCAKVEGCEDGACYCSLTQEWSEQTGVSLVGDCLPIGSYTDVVGIANLGSVRFSNITMSSWWSAENWCRAQGMDLIDIADFNCYIGGTTNKIVKNSNPFDYGENFCCAEGKECGCWDEYWDNNTIKDGYEDYVHEHYSEAIISLKENFPEARFWTKSNMFWDGYAFDISFSKYTNGPVACWCDCMREMDDREALCK